MAVSIVNSVWHGTTNSTSVPFAVPPTAAGNLLVVVVGYGAWAQPVAGITNTNAETFTQAPNAETPSGANRADIWYLENCAAGSTSVTVTFTGSQAHIEIGFYEIAGAKTSGAFDSANNSDGTASIVSAPLTPTISGEILIAGVYTDSELVTGVNSPWTIGPFDAGVINGFATSFYINPPLSSQQCPYTPGGTYLIGTTIASFKAALALATTKKWGTELVF